MLFVQNLLRIIDDVGEARPRGLSAQTINQLPTKAFKKSSISADDPTPECNICICEYREGDKLRILQCLHQFHAKCIDKWLSVSELMLCRCKRSRKPVLVVALGFWETFSWGWISGMIWIKVVTRYNKILSKHSTIDSLVLSLWVLTNRFRPGNFITIRKIIIKQTRIGHYDLFFLREPVN